MVVIRAARWPDDEDALAAIDTSFVTDRIYRVQRDTLSFRLIPEPVDPPYRKSYGSLRAHLGRLRQLRHVVVAEDGGSMVGVVAADLTGWNRRVQVEHLYVASGARGRGIGRALLASVIDFARAAGARCVWIETQNTNYPAAQFYLRLGYHLCGLDERLYDPRALGTEETALFFALDLAR